MGSDCPSSRSLHTYCFEQKSMAYRVYFHVLHLSNLIRTVVYDMLPSRHNLSACNTIFFAFLSHKQFHLKYIKRLKTKLKLIKFIKPY